MVDSGVEWIGEAPADWETYRLGAFFMKTKKLSGGSLPPGALSHGRVVEKTSEKLPDSTKITYQDVLAGDFLLNPINLNYDLKSLRTGLSSIDVCVSPAYIVMKRRSGCAEYLKYALHIFDIYRMKELGAGVRQTIGFPDIQREPIVAPGAQEQQAIAIFLDHHVGLIDRERELIAQKIGLLKDKRKALIFECVTGKRTIVEAQRLAGLDDWSDIVGSGPLVAVPTPGTDDPFVKGGRLVDSGVDWIGEVPEGWEINRLSEVFHSHKRGATPAYLDESDFKIVNQACLSSYRLDTSKAKPATPMIGQRGRFSEGDLLVASTGGGVMGKCALATMDGYCDSHVTILKPVEKISALLVFYWMSASFEWIQQFGKGSTNQIELQVKPLLTTAFPLPPINIQRSIATFLDHETNLIDREIELLETKSSLLSDKRKALIFEAVTGKIDCTQL
jgi:type I restriction enzyme S subunit